MFGMSSLVSRIFNGPSASLGFISPLVIEEDKPVVEGNVGEAAAAKEVALLGNLPAVEESNFPALARVDSTRIELRVDNPDGSSTLVASVDSLNNDGVVIADASLGQELSLDQKIEAAINTSGVDTNANPMANAMRNMRRNKRQS